ncbi:MAG: hypothetical protein NC489_24770 [Ruminococcus flavefaciens]|nr:hypothetical protein [Ruminococcus flavefaciens]
MKKIISMMLLLAMVASIITTGKEADAASFKGNLNATYKSSEGKITVKKVSGKKVKVTLKANGINCGTWTGNVASPNTVKFTIDGGEKIQLKWKNKNTFSAKSTNGFSTETIQMARAVVTALNKVTYKKQGGSSSSSSSIPKSVIGTYASKIKYDQYTMDFIVAKIISKNKIKVFYTISNYYEKNGYDRRPSYFIAKKSGNKFVASSKGYKFSFTISGKKLKLKELKNPNGKKLMPKTYKKTTLRQYEGVDY